MVSKALGFDRVDLANAGEGIGQDIGIVEELNICMFCTYYNISIV